VPPWTLVNTQTDIHRQLLISYTRPIAQPEDTMALLHKCMVGTRNMYPKLVVINSNKLGVGRG